MLSRRVLYLASVVFLLAFSIAATSGVQNVAAQAPTPQQASTAAATPTLPPNPNPCARTQLLTVQVNASIFYAPDVRAETRYKLKPGSKFFVCVNNTNPNWTAFILVGDAGGVQKPLWTPNNVFG